MSAKSQFFLTVNFELKVLFIELLVLQISLLNFFETVFDFLVHDFLNVFNLALLFDQHIFCALSFWGGLHQLFFFFTDFKVKHLYFFDKGDSVLTCLVFQCVVLFNGVIVFLLENFISAKEQFFVIIWLFLISRDSQLILIFYSWELILKTLNLLSESIDFFRMDFLLFPYFFLNLLHKIFLTWLILFPVLKYFLLKSLLFHFIVIFKLNDRKVNVSFLLLEVFSVLLIEWDDLFLVVLFLLFELLCELLYFGFISFGDIVHVVC